MRQTKNALFMLIKAYRAIYKNALLAGMAGTVAASAFVINANAKVINEEINIVLPQGTENYQTYITDALSNANADAQSDVTIKFDGNNSQGRYASWSIASDYTLNSLTLHSNYDNSSMRAYQASGKTLTLGSLTLETGVPDSGTTPLTDLYVSGTLNSANITLKPRSRLFVDVGGVVNSDTITGDYQSSILMYNNSKITGNVTLLGNGGDDAADTDKNGEFELVDGRQSHESITATLEGNLTSKGGSTYVDSGDGERTCASMTLNITGNYTQSSVALNDDTGLSVTAYQPKYTSIANVTEVRQLTI